MDNTVISKPNLMTYPFCQKILPLVYDDSLSYYESICKMVDKVNEVVEYIDNFESDVLVKAEELCKNYFAQGKQFTEEQITEVKKLIDETNTMVETVNQRITDVQTDITADVNTKYVRLQQMLDQQWVNMIDYINSQVIEVKVRNFFTGEIVSIQSMFDYLAGLHLTDAGTYAQVSGNNTYQYYIDKNETYTNVLMTSRTFFNS